MPLKRSLIALIVIAVSTPIYAGRDISARIEDGWIIASQGSDESLQIIRVKIWGTTRIEGSFHQLDDDPEKEYIVTSRGIGSGPYYKLQIVDFVQDGILTWSYDSAGIPKIEDGIVSLGKLPNDYQGAATKPIYERFRLSITGLSKIERVE